MKIIRRFWWLFVIGFIVGGGWMLWKNSAEAKMLDENTYSVKRQNLTETLSLSGNIDAEEKSDVKFQTSGLLTWVGVKEGDVVKKYQVLASLDKRELKNSMSQLLNSYMKERWDFEQGIDDNDGWETRGMTDAARDAVKRSLEKNQYDLNNSVLAVEANNLSQKFASIWTPIDGVVTKIDVPQPGSNITPAGAVFTIINPKTLYFSATADQTEVVNFKSGKRGIVRLESFPEIEMEGEVVFVSFVPKTGESGTVYELKMQIDLSQIGENELKMGMTGDADFVIRDIQEVLAVPEAYVKRENDKYFVTKVINKKKEKAEVITGETVEGMIEIKEGLNEGDTIYNQS